MTSTMPTQFVSLAHSFVLPNYVISTSRLAPARSARTSPRTWVPQFAGRAGTAMQAPGVLLVWKNLFEFGLAR
jgi:hypothetical protein